MVKKLSWSETTYFYKGGPLRLGPKLPVEPKCKIFFKTAISWELSDRDTKSGSLIDDFFENLIESSFLSKSLPPGVKENRKKLGC